jgi:hypothetical protein
MCLATPFDVMTAVCIDTAERVLIACASVTGFSRIVREHVRERSME